MDQGKVARIVDGSEKLEGRMERGEAVAEANGVGVAESRVGGRGVHRVITSAHDGVVGQGVFWNANAGRGAAGVVRRVLNGDDRIQTVVRATEKDKEQLFAIAAKTAIGGESPLCDEWDID